MHVIKQIFFICCWGMLFSCGKKPSNTIQFKFDYEHSYGWMDLTLEKGIAHSGLYSERIAADKEYSHGFTLSLTQIHSAPVKKMKVGVWANATEINAPVYLVLDVFVPGSNEHLKFVQKDLAPALQKKAGWRFFSAEIDLTGLQKREAIVKAYVWNSRQQNLWIDDFSIEFEK